MDSKAPDVKRLGMGTQDFSLLFAEKLDDYHNADLQRFHLVKLLQLPPDKRGRYVLAGWYVDLARQLGLHMNQLTSVLNVRDGRQHRYWRIGTSEGDNDPVFWPAMRDGNYVAVGWPKLGDLAPDVRGAGSEDRIEAAAQQSDPEIRPRSRGEALRRSSLHEGNGRGRCGSGGKRDHHLWGWKSRGERQYRHEPTDDFPHRRPITWLDRTPGKCRNRRPCEPRSRNCGSQRIWLPSSSESSARSPRGMLPWLAPTAVTMPKWRAWQAVSNRFSSGRDKLFCMDLRYG